MPTKKRTIPIKSRPLQKGYTHGEIAALARNAIDLFPQLPAAHLVQEIANLAEPEQLARLDEILRTRFLIRLVRSLRAQDRREADQAGWLFPEIQIHAAKLPDRVPIGKRETVERAKVCYEDLANYLKILNKRHRSSTRVAAVVALMDLWPERTPKTQGKTLAQVDREKARGSGLI